MKRIFYLSLISLMAIPTYGQRKQYAKQLSKYLGAAGAVSQHYNKSSTSYDRRIQIFKPLTNIPSISDNLPLPGNNPAISTELPSIEENVFMPFRHEHESYMAQTDSINNMMRKTIKENNCDSCRIHVFFLDGYITMFNVRQLRETTNVNMISIESLDVCSTSYLGVYSRFPTEPQYGIKVECYKNGEHVSKEKVEELADRVARFLKFYKFVMESPHYNFPMLTVPPHLINSTPKQ